MNQSDFTITIGSVFIMLTFPEPINTVNLN